MIFEEFMWNKNSQTQLYNKMTQAYHGFNETDWQRLINWRNEMLNATKTTCEQHAAKWLRPITDKERANLYGD